MVSQKKTMKRVQGGSYSYQFLVEHYDRFEKIVVVYLSAMPILSKLHAVNMMLDW